MNVSAPMRLLPGFLAVALLTLAAGGCSHGTINEIPTAPAARISKLTVTPPGGIIIEGTTLPVASTGGLPASDTFGAFAQYTDGSGQYVAARWSSSDTNVITIDGGTFTARGRGTATVTATAEGVTATETFIVQGGITGTWAGMLAVDQCGATAAAIYDLICYPPNQGRTPGTLAAGVTVPMAMVITGSGSELRAVAQFGDARGSLTGIDRGQNFLSLIGDLTVNTTTVSVVYWDARVHLDAMDGFLTWHVRVAGFPGYAEVMMRFDRVSRR